jgi:hypothetical protein
MPAKTQREREAQQRQAKLDRITEQVEDGSLVIRQMTDEEKARFARSRPAPSGAAESRRDRRRRGRSPGRTVPPGPRR